MMSNINETNDDTLELPDFSLEIFSGKSLKEICQLTDKELEEIVEGKS